MSLDLKPEMIEFFTTATNNTPCKFLKATSNGFTPDDLQNDKITMENWEDLTASRVQLQQARKIWQ